jgi:hypothetical protein
MARAFKLTHNHHQLRQVAPTPHFLNGGGADLTTRYSCRNATAGSVAAARRAGINEAASAVSASTPPTRISVWTSQGSVWNSIEAISCPLQWTPAAPTPNPRTASVSELRSALTSENTEKIAAAVKELRKAPDAPAAPERLRRLERRCDEVAAEFGGLSKARPQGIDREMLVAVFLKLSGKLARMKLEMGI